MYHESFYFFFSTFELCLTLYNKAKKLVDYLNLTNVNDSYGPLEENINSNNPKCSTKVSD